ncbi:MAG: site-specific integrase [Lachnospiraceae bacterium]|nr:site-specific integrase [Lachnospiraceae bacterium]
MWSQERENKIRYFERYVDPLTGKTKTVSCTLSRASNKKAAALLRQKIEAQCSRAAVPEALTLRDLVECYAAHQSQTVKDSTADRNAFEAKAVLDMLGPDTLVDRLTVAYVMEKLLAAGETATCTNARIKFIKAMFRWGYKSDLIASPAIADKLEYLPDRRKKERLSDKYMERHELEAVMDAMTVERWRLLTQFLCLSGLRIGELIALDDSDVGDRYIHVSKTYDLRTGTLSETPKTDSSNRDVYIQPELAECISQMRTERAKLLLRSGKRSSLFYPDSSGKYMHYHAYNKYLKETTERVIGRGLTPHACRHTMTSIFAAQGAPLDAISRRLGHSTSEVTRNIYYHVTAQQRKQDEAAIMGIRVFG